MNIKKYVHYRNGIFLVFLVLACAAAYGSLRDLYYSSRNSPYYSHIVLIPLVSAYLLYQKRFLFTRKDRLDAPHRGNGGEVLVCSVKGHDDDCPAASGGKSAHLRLSLVAGVPVLLAGVLLYIIGRNIQYLVSQNDFTSVIALAAVLFVHGAFMLCYGVNAYKVAMFPLLFLIFVIPIPDRLMEGIIYLLQKGSTEFADMLLVVSGTPYLREGFTFHLPGQSVEVAPQCSGIRSGLALFITCILAAHLFLKTGWRKVVLALVAIPVAMLKNGIRITTLTLLGTYVDPRILSSSLHREGGIPFFVVALLLMVPVLFYLRKAEKKRGKM